MNYMGSFGEGTFAGVMIVLLIILLIGNFIFEVKMFLDVLKNTRITSTRRIIWITGMITMLPLAAGLYYFMDYQAQ